MCTCSASLPWPLDQKFESQIVDRVASQGDVCKIFCANRLTPASVFEIFKNNRLRPCIADMHACLVINELVVHIMGFLMEGAAPGSGRPHGSREIARLARTCKSFMDPALDLLWRTQGAVSPLVMCLPCELWEKRDVSNTIVCANSCQLGICH